jgi:hypothetical protein
VGLVSRLVYLGEGEFLGEIVLETGEDLLTY